MCSGFAVLNVKNSKVFKFLPLTHVIPWADSEDLSFYAVWKQMPHYCKYRHAEGHTVADCDKRKAKFSCWTCGGVGHMAASYPKEAPQKKTKSESFVSNTSNFVLTEDSSSPGNKRLEVETPLSVQLLLN